MFAGRPSGARATDAGTFRAAVDELERLHELGVSVLELLPVHQFDPDEGNYWGYMPVVFGAIHREYAAGRPPATELADLIIAAHDHDIEVWLDVVVNHTTEAGSSGPRLLTEDAGRTGLLRGADRRARTSTMPARATS